MSNNNSSGGADFFDLLLIALIVLKLCGVIDWSWWWICGPFLFIIIVGIIAKVLEDR